MAWLAARPAVVRFTRAELHQHLRRTFPRPAALDGPLALLEELRYLVREPAAVRRWAVNPQWHRGG
jgi:hypothetical protein